MVQWNICAELIYLRKDSITVINITLEYNKQVPPKISMINKLVSFDVSTRANKTLHSLEIANYYLFMKLKLHNICIIFIASNDLLSSCVFYMARNLQPMK